MSQVVADSLRWPARKWWMVLALILLAQIGLIFWLGEKKFPLQRPPAQAPTLVMFKKNPSELLTLNDPTLFALPHKQSFSGIAWLTPPTITFQPTHWTEPPRFLQLSAHQLGGGGMINSQVALSITPRLPVRLEPEMTVAPGSLKLANDHSTFHIEGNLAQRRLLTTFNLPSWPSPDILTNSVVQLLVDARGLPLSASLLSRSGSKNADQFALDQANAARFASVVQTGPNRSTNVMDGVTLGEVVFEWHTSSSANTNGVPASP